ncbi:unnamed protein product [Porites lobata]|uniref:UMOD/GP2/OIT3-like D8C domain-containing protein n=1 Tax=Porites lobata TaxID=104759 RepID=A0ABN8S9Q7_9CNID|nr:unnamed protein product [Porites lobata]
MMPTTCVAKFHCGAYGPGWLNGDHPMPQDGRVKRRVCFHLEGECCKEKISIQVRNCGKFMVYFLPPAPRCPLKYCGSKVEDGKFGRFFTRSFTGCLVTLILLDNFVTVPRECKSYGVLNETDRARGFYNPFLSLTDAGLTPGWHRFMGKAGSRMSHKCVNLFHCGTHASGWLRGAHPLITEGAVMRQVCFHWNGDCCYFKQQILVRNCEDFYVYELPGTEKSFLRYCGNSKKHHHLEL